MASSQQVVVAASSNSGSESSSSSQQQQQPLSPDNLTVQLLARLDATSYNLALNHDANSLSHNFLLPYNIPWGCSRFHQYYADSNNGNSSIPSSSETYFVERGLPFDIDELDAIGTKRFGGDQSGDREVQRTMLELLSQLDGFGSNDMIKVIAATNRPDVLDPALLRSGRLDRKIELPHPAEDARAKIMRIHSRKMNVSSEVVFEELARSCEDFNGAQLKAVCVEAGMLALRGERAEIVHEDFIEAISVVAAKKKGSLDYFA